MTRARSGFSLLELNVVVVIVGLLASMAAPSYTAYLRRGQAVEAMTNLQTIGYLEEVHILETGRSIACPASPERVPRAEQMTFESSQPWIDLGVHMEARVRYQYEVEAPGRRSYRVVARGDLDGDGVESRYVFDSATLAIDIQGAGE